MRNRVKVRHKNISISIIMATYFEDILKLKKSISSILMQDFRDYEFIIVTEADDVNLDYLHKIEYVNNNVILIINNKNAGLAKSLNSGIKISKGKYICRMDSDDVCATNRLQHQFSYMEDNPKIDVLGTSVYLIDEQKKTKTYKKYPTNHEEIKNNFLFRCPIAHPSVIIKKNCFDLLGFYDESFKKCEDLELWLRFIKNGCVFENLDQPLLYYLKSEKNIYRDKSHWRFNYFARLNHQKKIYSRMENFLSLSLFYILQKFDFKNFRILKYFISIVKG